MARTRNSLLACGLALVMATACSSGGGKKEAAPTTTVAVATTAAATATTPSFTGQNSAQFCALAKTYNDRFTSVGANPTPAQLRTVAKEGQTAINQAQSTAPAEIKPDVDVIARTFNALLTELDKVNYDLSKLPPTALQSLSAPDFQTSTQRFQAYIKTVCGVGN